MKKEQTKAIREIALTGRLIDEALNQAARDAVQKHREAGLPLAVWKDGKTVWVQPDEVDAQQDRNRPAARRARRRTKSRSLSRPKTRLA